MRHGSERYIKCVVWDLDNTLWKGILSETDQVEPRADALNFIRLLDSRGILQSIASKNDHEPAMKKLREFGIDNYFLFPQINWGSKAESVKKITDLINIGIDTVAFIDDQPFEREEVNFSHPQVLCIDGTNLDPLPDMPEFNPKFVTEFTKNRRLIYLDDIRRNRSEEEFQGPKEEFLSTLEMTLSIAQAKEKDLKRAEELTVRTHQLNSTGYAYSYEELNIFRQSDRHTLLISTLEDKFGSYGRIGLTLLERSPDVWTIKLLLMSCRVMSRGVGSVMLNYLRQEAGNQGVRLQAEFLSTDRNRMMYISYKFAHFREIDQRENIAILENDLTQAHGFPKYMRIILPSSFEK
ncbi:MAG: hypothetical protein B6244_04115 [Candidatus Cloacimonetes bacterium 4572_55]|nr:MAG: hypothetical protein B6244_04115 [Candidatus Cloacimonetes bacterium 4572_55]